MWVVLWQRMWSYKTRVSKIPQSSQEGTTQTNHPQFGRFSWTQLKNQRRLLSAPHPSLLLGEKSGVIDQKWLGDITQNSLGTLTLFQVPRSPFSAPAPLASQAWSFPTVFSSVLPHPCGLESHQYYPTNLSQKLIGSHSFMQPKKHLLRSWDALGLRTWGFYKIYLYKLLLQTHTNFTIFLGKPPEAVHSCHWKAQDTVSRPQGCLSPQCPLSCSPALRSPPVPAPGLHLLWPHAPHTPVPLSAAQSGSPGGHSVKEQERVSQGWVIFFHRERRAL